MSKKLHAAVAKSAFPSQNAKKTDGLGALLEVSMSNNCTPLWREANFQVKMLQSWRSRSTFWSFDAEKWHTAVARSAFVRGKCTKHVSSRQFFEVRMWNNCMNLWREARLSVKMYKIPVFLARFFKFRCRTISQVVN